MNLLPILDFTISIIFIALLLSLFISWIVQWYSSKTNRKGKFLKKMLSKMIGDADANNWSARLYRHPLIESLSIKYNRVTSYIPPKLFAGVLTDLIIKEGKDYSFKQDPDSKKVEHEEDPGITRLEDIHKGIISMPESDSKRIFKLFYDKAEGKPETFLAGVEEWYTEYMVRVNYSYKRLLRKPLLITGLIIALLFNIDFIRLSDELWNDVHIQQSLVLLAEEFAEGNKEFEDIQPTKEFFREYKESIGLPIGWCQELKEVKKDQLGLSNENNECGNLFKAIRKVVKYLFSGENWFWRLAMKLLGLFVTATIVSFGAPFWFEVLQKITSAKKSLNIKSTKNG